MDNIQEAYTSVILNEANEDKYILQIFKKIFPEIKIGNFEVTRKFSFRLRDYIDEDEIENWSRIDAFTDLVKKKLKNATVEFNGNSIEIEEL